MNVLPSVVGVCVAVLVGFWSLEAGVALVLAAVLWMVCTDGPPAAAAASGRAPCHRSSRIAFNVPTSLPPRPTGGGRCVPGEEKVERIPLQAALPTHPNELALDPTQADAFLFRRNRTEDASTYHTHALPRAIAAMRSELTSRDPAIVPL